MRLDIQPFAALDNNTLFELFQLRVNVFVVEQQCPYPDLDELDRLNDTFHVTLKHEHQVIGCARCLAPHTAFETPAIGRMAVAKSYRGQGIAKQIMRAAIQQCQQQWPHQPITIAAQHYLLEAYSHLGFQSIGEPYDEDDILHQNMRLEALN